MDLSFRSETADDEAFLYQLYASTRAEELALTGWDEVARATFLQLQFNAQRHGYRAQFPGADYLLVLDGGTRIGRMVVNRTRQEIRLVDLIIDPSHRGHGAGTQLLKQLIVESDATQAPLRLSALRGGRACEWYLRLGFRVTKDSDVHVELEHTPVAQNK